MELIEVSFKSGKRGLKTCRGCSKLVGVRTSKCQCGFDFTKKIESPVLNKKIEIPKTSERTYYLSTSTFDVFWGTSYTNYIHHTLLIPSGKCPCELNNFSEEGIKNWALKILPLYLRDKAYKGVAVEALEYWAKEFYSKRENPEIETLIKKTLTELAKSTTF